MGILSASNLSFAIGSLKILKGVSFEIGHGEIVGLIGPNGSGKTTLFNLLSGFFKPESGIIMFNGQNITRASAPKRAQMGIGRVFQNFGIFREMTIEENILVAIESQPEKRARKPENAKKAVSQTLELIGLQDRAKEKASCLSGGQMRLLEISRTLAGGKELFLLDEPTAGVAPKMTSDIASLIKELKNENKTVMIIEHDLPFIAKICDRILVMDVGSIVLEGDPQSVQRDAKLKEIYFGAGPAG